MLRPLMGSSNPKYWLPLSSDINSVTGGLTGTHDRDSVANYYHPDTGLLTEVAVDIPRFESVGGYNALLVEPEGTNVCLRSREFDHASWQQVETPSPTANETGIDGVGNTAYTVTDNAGAALEYIYQEIVIPDDSNTHIAFMFFKKTTGASSFPGFGISFKNGTEVDEHVTVNTDDGTVVNRTTYDDGSHGVIDRGDWWQVWLKLTNNDTGNTKISIQMLPAINIDASATWVNTTTGSVIIDAAQVELNKNIPSSFIFTEASPVTRATESGYPRWTLPPSLFNAEGTCILWWRPGYAYDKLVTTISNLGIVTCQDSGRSLLFNFRTIPEAVGIATNDAANSAHTGIQWAANTWYKLIVKWGYSTGKMRVGIDDGGGVSWGDEETFDGSFDLGDYLRIGYDLFGPMHVRQLMLFRKALNDTMINHWSGSPA